MENDQRSSVSKPAQPSQTLTEVTALCRQFVVSLKAVGCSVPPCPVTQTLQSLQNLDNSFKNLQKYVQNLKNPQNTKNLSQVEELNRLVGELRGKTDFLWELVIGGEEICSQNLSGLRAECTVIIRRILSVADRIEESVAEEDRDQRQIVGEAKGQVRGYSPRSLSQFRARNEQPRSSQAKDEPRCRAGVQAKDEPRSQAGVQAKFEPQPQPRFQAKYEPRSQSGFQAKSGPQSQFGSQAKFEPQPQFRMQIQINTPPRSQARDLGQISASNLPESPISISIRTNQIANHSGFESQRQSTSRLAEESPRKDPTKKTISRNSVKYRELKISKGQDPLKYSINPRNKKRRSTLDQKSLIHHSTTISPEGGASSEEEITRGNPVPLQQKLVKGLNRESVDSGELSGEGDQTDKSDFTHSTDSSILNNYATVAGVDLMNNIRNNILQLVTALFPSRWDSLSPEEQQLFQEEIFKCLQLDPSTKTEQSGGEIKTSRQKKKRKMKKLPGPWYLLSQKSSNDHGFSGQILQFSGRLNSTLNSYAQIHKLKR